MSLGTAALRELLGGQVEIALMLRGKEITTGGYQRQQVPFELWKLRTDRALTEVTFGPFDEVAEYDAGAVCVSGEPEQLLPNVRDEVARIPPRATLRYEVTLEAS